MGFRINTNVPSIAAQRSLGQTNKAQANSLGRLSSGTRINKAADDAAGLAISEKLRSNIRSLKQANRNANDGISMIQTAEGGLNEISSILTRLRELSIQSASDTVTDRERTFTDVEYQNLKQEIQRIAQVTEFNGQKLLNGSTGKFDFQIDINNDDFEDRISYFAEQTEATLDFLDIAGLEVVDKTSSQDSLSYLDEAIRTVSGQRSDLGALQNRLVSTSNNLEMSIENQSAANSRIRDTDYAYETAEKTKLDIITQAGSSVLAQANAQGALAIKLLG